MIQRKKQSLSVKFAHLSTEMLSFGKQVGFKPLCASVAVSCIGFPKLNNECALFPLYDKIWKNLIAYINQSEPLQGPLVDHPVVNKMVLTRKPAMLFMRVVEVFECLIKPFHQLNFSIANREGRSILRVLKPVVLCRGNLVNRKTALSIDDARKVSKFDRIINFFSVGSFWHKCVNLYMKVRCTTLSHRLQLHTRLNDLAVKPA